MMKNGSTLHGLQQSLRNGVQSCPLWSIAHDNAPSVASDDICQVALKTYNWMIGLEHTWLNMHDAGNISDNLRSIRIVHIVQAKHFKAVLESNSHPIHRNAPQEIQLAFPDASYPNSTLLIEHANKGLVIMTMHDKAFSNSIAPLSLLEQASIKARINSASALQNNNNQNQ